MSEVPVTTPELDEPTEETVDPDKDRELKTGVGFQDDEATKLDIALPDVDDADEPNVDEPDEETV